MVSDGKHHCGSVADAVCVCAMWCVCVNGGMEWVVVGVAWCGQHTARLGVCGGACGVCVWQWCMHQVPCVCEGGGGTRALVVVVGGKASVMVAWEAHTGHTRTTKHHHGPHHQSRCVCVCDGGAQGAWWW